MPTPKDLPRDIGVFIRDMRRNAKISLRQLADQAGVSNPYLSQIERGLRKPSAEVLQQLASALRVSTPVMYLRAGLLDDKEGPGVLTAIAADAELTLAQKQSLSQIYETFRRENTRIAEAEAAAESAEIAAEVAEAEVDIATELAAPDQAEPTASKAPKATAPMAPNATASTAPKAAASTAPKAAASAAPKAAAPTAAKAAELAEPAPPAPKAAAPKPAAPEKTTPPVAKKTAKKAVKKAAPAAEEE
jgi:transcriptional regulator with XRE-family HTH domain